MPILPPAAPPSRLAILQSATGSIKSGFLAVGYTPELDELEIRSSPLHEQFTYILRFQGSTNTVVDRVPVRLEDILQTPAGQTLAVGSPRGIIEVLPSGCVEQPLPDMDGEGNAIWAASDHSVFICGSHRPFILQRQADQWRNLPLPNDCPALHTLWGRSASEVYFVGNDGWLLYFDGTEVVRLPVPTTNHLTSVARLNEHHFCLAGYSGTLLMGNLSGFRIVPTGYNDVILSLAAFRKSVYYPTDEGLWQFDGKSAPTLADPQPCRWVSELDDGLLVCDGDEAWVYDGTKLVPIDTSV